MDVHAPFLSLHNLLTAISTTVMCVSLAFIARNTELLVANYAKSQNLLAEQIGILRDAQAERGRPQANR
jgi:hypothetical protein